MDTLHDKEQLMKQWQEEYREKLKRANEELKDKNKKILCIFTIPDFILKKTQETED